jgi:hypothetical protein
MQNCTHPRKEDAGLFEVIAIRYKLTNERYGDSLLSKMLLNVNNYLRYTIME